MNKIITNLPLIADAAEYFDKQTSAAWKIRAALTNMVVWAASSFLNAKKADSAERMFSTGVVLATIRSWAHDSNESAFQLDLLPGNVRRTLGLERAVNVHDEAVRTARQKCINTRNASRFTEFYNAAANALEEQHKLREEQVEEIANLLSDSTIPLTSEMIDYAYQNFGLLLAGTEVEDSKLYDDASVERQADQIAETIGNCLESMYDVCDRQLNSAITTDKINRLSGYMQSIMQMMEIAGVDTARLAERRAKLEAQIEAQVSELNKSIKSIDEQINEQLAALDETVVAHAAEEVPADKPKRTRVPATSA